LEVGLPETGTEPFLSNREGSAVLTGINTVTAKATVQVGGNENVNE
jgi:hypothetical protein